MCRAYIHYSSIAPIALAMILSTIVLSSSGRALAQEFERNLADESMADDRLSEMSLQELLGLEIVTAAKTAQKASDSPATIYVIDDEQIRTRGYRTLEDVLDDIPEIEIQKQVQVEYVNYYTSRGSAGNSKFIILVDGFRQSSPASSPHVIGANFPVYNAKRVEILLGPSSALYGVDAFSAIVNIITKSGTEVGGIEAEVSYGSFNTADSHIHAGTRWNGIDIALGGTWFRSDGANLPELYPEDYRWYNEVYRDTGTLRLSPFADESAVVETGDPRPFNIDYRAYSLYGRVNADRFEFGYTRSLEDHSTSIGAMPEYSVYSDEARYPSVYTSAYAVHNYSIPDETISLKSSLHYATYELRPESRFINTYSGYYNGGYKYSSETSTTLEIQLFYQPHARVSLIQGITANNLSATPRGADLPQAFDRTVPADAQEIPYVGTDITDADGNDLSIPVNFYHIDEKTYGGYAQAIARVTDELELTAGARYDHNERYGGSFNPRLGAVFKPVESVSLRAMYSTASRSPSPYFAFQHFGSFSPAEDGDGNITGLRSNFWFIPNPDLETEELQTIEGNIFWLVTPIIGLSIRGHYLSIDNSISFRDNIGSGEFLGIAADSLGHYDNRGAATSYGGVGRMDARLRLGNGVNLRPYLAYSYVDGELTDMAPDGTETSLPLPFAAKHTIKAGIDATWRALSGSARLNYRSTSKNEVDDESTWGDTVIDTKLFLRYAAYTTDRYQLSLHLRADNVLNRKNRHLIFPIHAAGMPTIPQEPLRILAGMRLNL